jgi:hypothetical protein
MSSAARFVLPMILALACATAFAESPVVARWAEGQLTIDEVETALRLEHGHSAATLNLDSPGGRARFAGLVRQMAHDRILHARAAAEGVLDEPQLQLRQDLARRRALLGLAQERLIDSSVIVDVEQVERVLRERYEGLELPPLASFRFMFFEARRDADEAARTAARERADAARAALLDGEAFVDVAARLATPPIQGKPGDIIGPIEFQGRMPEVVTQALLTQEIEAAGEVLDTPNGFFLVQVVTRETERQPDFEALRAGALRELEQQARDQARRAFAQRLKAELNARFEFPAANASDDTIVVAADGIEPVTMGTLRRMASAEVDASEGLAALLAEDPAAGMSRILFETLLLARFGTPDDVGPHLDAAARRVVADHMRLRQAPPPRPRPTAEQLAEHYEQHGERFRTTLYDVSALQVSFPTMAEWTGSGAKIDYHHRMQEFAARIAEGATFAEMREEIGPWGRRGDFVETWTARPLGSLPFNVRRALEGVEVGALSQPFMLPDAVLLVRLDASDEGVPPLDRIRFEVERDWQRGQPAPPDPMSIDLDAAGFAWLVEPDGIRWSPEGRLVLADE